MIGIILIAAGIYVLAKGKIGVDNKKYLQKPKSIIVGIILIILGLLMGFVNWGLIAVLFIATIVASYYMAEEIVPENPNTIQNTENNSEAKIN
jgi:cytochrome c biogenesis protein CcdA